MTGLTGCGGGSGGDGNDDPATPPGPPPATADLAITNTPASVSSALGGSFTYDLVIRNNGPDDASGVVVTDLLSAATTLQSVTPSQGICSGTATIACNLGDLPRFASESVTIVATAVSAGLAANTASVTSDATDNVPANDSATAHTAAGTLLSAAVIQTAIDNAVDGDTVVIAPGVYVGNINFGGRAITLASQQGAATTIIDGNQAGSVVTFAMGETAASVLDGFTLMNGSASEGGGVSVQSASPTLVDNVIVANVACAGAGIGLGFASPVIQNNVISHNRKGGCTGGINGGGISIRGNSSPQILDNQITDNTSVEGGGLSLFAAGTPTISGNVIRDNAGGAIDLVNVSDALIVQNLIVNNHGAACGGVSWLVPSGARGPLLVNNTITHNDGSDGSGICADGFDAQAELRNNIIVAKPGQLAVFCGNFNDLDPPVFGFNNVFSSGAEAYGGSCADSTGSNGNISADPQFFDVAAEDYRPVDGSPSIDAGDNAAPSLPIADLAGNARIIDGDGDTLDVIDMGAYEFVP